MRSESRYGPKTRICRTWQIWIRMQSSNRFQEGSMAEYETGAIRNVALLGHSGAGKTSLLDMLLVKAGAIGEPGSLERGTTVSDFDPLEREYGYSLVSSLASLDFEDVHVKIGR